LLGFAKNSLYAAAFLVRDLALDLKYNFNMPSLPLQDYPLQEHATSGSAKLLLNKILPLESAEAAQKSFSDIFAACEVIGSGTRPFMESLDLFEGWFSRLKKKAVLKTLEIKDLRHFCLEVLALHEALSDFSSSWSKQTRALLFNAEEPLSAIDSIVTPRGEIRMDASETLYRLFKEKENLTRQIESTLDRLVKDHQMTSYLQDKYVTTREGRWVLPIKGGMKHYLPGVIHGSSQTKQTVFIEPEAVVPLNNRIRQIEVEIEDEIERLLTQLSEYLATQVNAFETGKDCLLSCDVLFAKAQYTLRIDGKACEFSEDEIYLQQLKNPQLVLSGKPVVANSVRLHQQKRILLLSGPNAGGKTVLLKSIGVAADMARCGLPICAEEGSRLPFFKNIHVGIGDSQNIEQELSTFAAHLKILDQGTHMSGLNNLILIDEICGSTDPEEGSALARSFIEKFIKQNVFSVITSHLSPLKSGWQPDDPLLNGSLEYDPKSGRPTYQFLAGIPGDSLAIQTAKRIGINLSIVERAIELLSPHAKAKLARLDEIEQMKNDIQGLREQLKKDSQKAKLEKDKYENLIQQFEKDKENQLKKLLRDSERKIEEMISLAKAEQTFKKHTSLQEIKIQLPEIIKSKSGSELTSSTAITNAEEFAKKYPTGSKIFVPSLGQDGIVQSTPNNKGEVLILSGSVRLSLPWQELRSAKAPANPTASLVRRSSPVTIALEDSEKTLDLRGKTVDEALGDLEMQLDRSASQKEERIKIIHGHGTEALKKSIRTYLSRSIYVKKWKSGSPEQGGDGVTWVELNQD
jgi:DNA mismatch repair protein MutS2